MGFALTIVYIAVTIVSPEQFGPEWANYHALLYLAGIGFLFSLPSIVSDAHLRSSLQTYLLLGFIFAIAMSKVANGWIGGVMESWQTFLPSAAVFFFIVANVTTTRRLKILTLTVVASCLFVIVEALCGYYGGFRGEMFVLRQNLYSPDAVVGQIARLRGAGFLNDPNDFAQLILIALPLIFIAWQRQRTVVNSVFVLVPTALLLWALYLTHSRGALIALAVLALMVGRKALGIGASVALGVSLLLILLALDFTGGRAISAAEGADRLSTWATGLELFKSAPLFGIGFGSFTDFNDITAHNSFVLCLAELGLVGSILWVALLVTTMTGLNRIIKRQEPGQMEVVSDGVEQDEAGLEVASYFYESPVTAAIEGEAAADIEIGMEPLQKWQNVPKHWVVLMRLGLVSVITTGCFLSRSYKTPLFLVLGLATATIALQKQASTPRIRDRWLFSTLAVEAAAILSIYGIVRLR